MRIVALADTHLFHEDLAPIPDGDVLVHAGDLCRAGTLDELRTALDWLRDTPHRHKILVAGNHDRSFEDTPARARAMAAEAGIVYLQDSAAAIDGVRFWGSPWQPAYNDWAFNLPRGAPLAERWALIPDDTHVLITHGPPRGYGDDYPAVERLGCVDLLAAARRVQPALHLFGHIHNDGGAWRDADTWFANVTTWECERPASVFDLDCSSERATPVTVPPARTD